MSGYHAEVKNLGPNRKEIVFTFPAEHADRVVDDRLREIQKTVKLRGFRPGRVPMNLVRQMFLKDVVADIAGDLITEFLDEIAEEHGLDLLGSPKVVDHSYRQGEGLTVRVEVEVFPELSVPDPSTLHVEKTVIEVTDEDVDRRLEEMREMEAIVLDVDDGAQEGDFILGKLKELDSTGLPLVGQKEREVAIRLVRDEGLDEEKQQLVEQLLGVKPGEVRRIVTSRPLYGEPRQGNDEYVYSLTVEKVTRRELPELDDEFAKDIGDFETLEQLREAVRRGMEAEARRATREIFHDNIRNELVKSVDFEPPEALVRKLLDVLMKDYREKHPDSRIPDADLAKELRPEAVALAKWTFIRNRLIEQYGLEVTDDDVDIYIEELVKANPDRAEEIRKRYNSDEARSDLRFDLQTERLFRFLESKVQATEVKFPYYVRRKIHTTEGAEEERLEM